MALTDFIPPPLVMWSMLVHFAVFVILLYSRRIIYFNFNLKATTFRTVSEFLFSVAWVVLTLEDAVLFNTVSERTGVLFLGLRLFLFPFTFHKMFGNPCEVLFHYLKRPSRTWKTDAFVRPLCAQLLAIPVGIGTSILIWKLLGFASSDYEGLTGKKIEYFLSVSPLEGVIIEAGISFLMFLPTLFLPASLLVSILETSFITLLVYQFGSLTGAFMNPMAAMACFMMWQTHTLGFEAIFVHLFVFTIGPLIGTLAALLLAKYLKRRYDQQMQAQVLAQARLLSQARSQSRTHSRHH